MNGEKMKLRHKEKGYVISVNSKHDRMIVSKDGFVHVAGRGYKGFNKVRPEVINVKFEEIA